MAVVPWLKEMTHPLASQSADILPVTQHTEITTFSFGAVLAKFAARCLPSPFRPNNIGGIPKYRLLSPNTPGRRELLSPIPAGPMVLSPEARLVRRQQLEAVREADFQGKYTHRLVHDWRLVEKEPANRLQLPEVQATERTVRALMMAARLGSGAELAPFSNVNAETKQTTIDVEAVVQDTQRRGFQFARAFAHALAAVYDVKPRMRRDNLGRVLDLSNLAAQAHLAKTARAIPVVSKIAGWAGTGDKSRAVPFGELSPKERNRAAQALAQSYGQHGDPRIAVLALLDRALGESEALEEDDLKPFGLGVGVVYGPAWRDQEAEAPDQILLNERFADEIFAQVGASGLLG